MGILPPVLSHAGTLTTPWPPVKFFAAARLSDLDSQGFYDKFASLSNPLTQGGSSDVYDLGDEKPF
jgi:hypothetical protein